MNPAPHPSIPGSKATPRTRAWPRGTVAAVLLSAAVAVGVMTLTDGPVSNGERTAERQGITAGGVATQHPGAASSNSQGRVEAMIDRVYDFGMRRIVVCLSSDKTEGMRRRHADDVSGKAGVTLVRCGGSSSTIVAAAAEIAAADPQAVIFDGNTSEATLFIEDLRARGSFAMVVLTSSVHPELLAKELSPRAKVWLAVTDDAPRRSPSADDTGRVRMGMLTATGAILTR